MTFRHAFVSREFTDAARLGFYLRNILYVFNNKHLLVYYYIFSVVQTRVIKMYILLLFSFYLFVFFCFCFCNNNFPLKYPKDPPGSTYQYILYIHII